MKENHLATLNPGPARAVSDSAKGNWGRLHKSSSAILTQLEESDDLIKMVAWYINLVTSLSMDQLTIQVICFKGLNSIVAFAIDRKRPNTAHERRTLGPG